MLSGGFRPKHRPPGVPAGSSSDPVPNFPKYPRYPRGAPKVVQLSPMKNVLKYQAHPWGREVWFTQDDTALKALGKKFDLNLDLEGSLGLCWGTSTRVIVIWVRPGSDVSVLVHECCHAALDILDYAGMNPAHANGEPMCYTLQRMIEQFAPHLIPPQNS